MQIHPRPTYVPLEPRNPMPHAFGNWYCVVRALVPSYVSTRGKDSALAESIGIAEKEMASLPLTLLA
jgi:hypothetical protein